jgi:hypothetical protein
VVDDREAVRREAEPYRHMSDEQRLELLAAACRAAARMLSLREDREKALTHSDPLPESSVRALKRLREAAKTRAEAGDADRD